MQITAGMVKELRERTGAGMMECKKALVETDGDIDVAIEQMRIAGLARADKKSGRIAADGTIAICIAEDGKSASMLEVNCETDFVSKGDGFCAFAGDIASRILSDAPSDVERLLELPMGGGEQIINTARQALVTKVGENIQVRRFVRESTDSGVFGSYSHGARIGVIVCVEGGGDAALAKDIAMHVAASKPECISEEGVPAELLAKEKAILIAEAQESGKPDNIIEKMVEGRIKKYLAEITLVGQPFVKNPDVTVGQLLASSGATVAFFKRFEVGEGIEKKEENFADEVMAQVHGS